jgi:hypothetical protein
LTAAIAPAAFDDRSLPVLALLEPPEAPDEDEPPVEPVTDELPSAPVPDDEPPLAPDEEPAAGEPDDEPVEPLDEPDPDEPLAPLDDEPLEPLEPLEPILPVAPALVLPPVLEPVDGLALDDEPPDRLPDEPALAEEPGVLLFRLLDLSSFPKLDWSLPMLLLPCLLASTPFPSLDF